MADQIQVTLDDPTTIELLRSKVRSGEYASEADAVREVIAAWREEQTEYECWLKDEIGAAYDDALAHPESLIPIEEVERRLAELRIRRKEIGASV